MYKDNSNTLEGFVADLIKKRGLENLDLAVVDQLKADLFDRAENRINAAILANIPKGKLEYFEKILDRSDTEEIRSFCERNIYDLDKVIAKELAEFRESYLAS